VPAYAGDANAAHDRNVVTNCAVTAGPNAGREMRQPAGAKLTSMQQLVARVQRALRVSKGQPVAQSHGAPARYREQRVGPDRRERAVRHCIADDSHGPRGPGPGPPRPAGVTSCSSASRHRML
jgi:hypothetical protein